MDKTKTRITQRCENSVLFRDFDSLANHEIFLMCWGILIQNYLNLQINSIQ